MKLLILHEGYAPILAGAESIAWETAHAMTAQGIDVTVVTKSEPLQAAELWPAVRARTGLLDLTPGQLGALADGKPMIVHLVDLTPRAAELANKFRQEHACPLVVSPVTHVSFWQQEASCRQALREADRVVALSHGEAAALAELDIDPARTIIIPHLGPIHGRKPARPNAPVEPPFVLFLSRLMRSKGYLDLLQAAPQVWSSVPAMQFVFAGPSVDPDVAEQMGQCADSRIVWRGIVSEEEKHRLLSSAFAICLPTRADVLPLVVLEAWAHGTPVISYDYRPAGCEDPYFGPRIIANLGPDCLAAAILRLRSEPGLQAKLRREGPAHLRIHFDAEVNMRRLAALYGEAVAESAAPCLVPR